jgi:hypothetical protein
MVSGAATAMASPRIRPLWVSAHQMPAAVRPSPAMPTSTTATLALKPIAARGTSTAAAAATRARRASQRWAMVARPGACCSVVTIP